MAERRLQRSFTRAVDEGSERLNRSTSSLLSTGAVGGMDIGVGLLAYLLVLHETGNHVVASLFFGLGFVILTLASSELFTENFLVPIVAVVAGRASVGQVLRLWVGTFAANLLGGAVLIALVVAGFPGLHDTLVEAAAFYPEQGIGLRSFALGALGGAVITLMTWVHRSVRDTGTKVAVSLALGALLVLGPLNHSVVGSIEMIGALLVGAPFGVLDWLGITAWIVLGNAVGGVILVTPLRTVQVGVEQVRREQDRAEEDAAQPAPTPAQGPDRIGV